MAAQKKKKPKKKAHKKKTVRSNQKVVVSEESDALSEHKNSKMDNKTVGLLEQAFQLDYNVTQACIHAGISRETYYRHYNSNEVFRDKMDVAKQYIQMLTKRRVIELVNNNDPATVRWFAERRAKNEETGENEYSQKQEVKHTGAIADTELTEEDKDILEKFKDKDPEKLRRASDEFNAERTRRANEV